jgi:hypothetical protein
MSDTTMEQAGAGSMRPLLGLSGSGSERQKRRRRCP